MKPLVFYFTFFNEDTEVEKTFAFVTENPKLFYSSLKISNFDDLSESDVFSNLFNTMENRYGVHDWSSSPRPEVDAIAYSTYEVDDNEISNVMNDWLNAFTKSGCICTPIVEITTLNTNDYQIYQECISKSNNFFNKKKNKNF